MSEPRTKHEELRYEQTDARTGALFRFAAALTLGVALAAGTAFGLLAYLQRLERWHDPAPPPLGLPEPGQLPPEPRLQPIGRVTPGPTPVEDLRAIRAEEEQALKSYGWVDRKAGVVHIDIDEAMKLLVRRGLPPSPSPGRQP